MGNAFPTVQEQTTYYFTSNGRKYESRDYVGIIRQRLLLIQNDEDVSEISIKITRTQLAVS